MHLPPSTSFPPVSSRLLYRVGILVFKCVKSLALGYFVLALLLGSHCTVGTHETGRNLTSASGQRTFLYRGISLWNSLMESVNDRKSVTGFQEGTKGQL